MPNLLEWYYSGWIGPGKWSKASKDFDRAPERDKESWHAYSKDPAEAYQQFHERVRESENFFINDTEAPDNRPTADNRPVTYIIDDGKPTDGGKELLDEIRMLSETRHDVEIEEPGRTNSTRSYRSP